MRHRLTGRQLGRAKGPRRAMYRIMVTDFLRHGRIQTTVAKAKEVRSLAEGMITLGKNGTVSDRRNVSAFVTDKTVVKKIFDDIAPKYTDRLGGYTRITRKGNRPGDGAEMVFLELVD